MRSITEFNSMQSTLDTRQTVAPAVQGMKPAGKSDTGNALPAGGEKLPAETGAKSTASTTPVDKKDSVEKSLENAVKSLNDYVQKQQLELQFVVDEGTGRTVVKVYDATTDEVIRQIPSEQMMELSRRMIEMSEDKGSLFQSQA